MKDRAEDESTIAQYLTTILKILIFTAQGGRKIKFRVIKYYYMIEKKQAKF